ncbi:MAG: hypothetical protein AAGD13_01095 [Pseudomonadota bacterium]
MIVRFILIVMMSSVPMSAYAGGLLGDLIDLNIDTRKEIGRELDEAHRQIKAQTPDYAASELRPARVWLHIRSDDQLALGTNIRELVGEGVQVAEGVRVVEWMPVQTVSNGPRQSQIRFFKEADAKTVAALRTVLETSGQSFQILDLTSEYASSTWIKTGHLEIWLAPNI